MCAFELEQHSSTVIAGVLDAHALALTGGVLRPRRTMTRQSARDRILTAAHDYFHNAVAPALAARDAANRLLERQIPV